MNRFFSVFLAAVFSCTCAFSQSTNITSGGVINLSGFQFVGSGDYPDNYAANVANVTSLQTTNSTYNGGAGGTDTTSTGLIQMNGGTGLRLGNTGPVTVFGSDFQGGKGGTINVTTASDPSAKGGHGIEVAGTFDLLFAGSTIASGGDAGTINNGTGRGKSVGGNAIHIAVDDLAGSIAVSSGTYQGGRGGSANYNSSEKLDNTIQLINFQQNGARGGHGLYLFQTDMFREVARSLEITGGTFIGGNGGSAVNANAAGDAIANGGSGIFVGSVSDVTISGGTFIGGSAGTGNGTVAESGAGATFWDSNVEITAGDFQGDDRGLFFGSVYYASTLNISSGRFDNVEMASVDSGDFGPPFIGDTVVTVSGGDLGNLYLTGNSTHDVTITGGTIDDLVFEDSGVKNVALGAGATVSGGVAQYDGSVNFSAWADEHFTDTTIQGGTMNFNNQAFNLQAGSSFSVLDVDAAVNFNSGFTARSNSQINLVYEGAGSNSKIEGTGLEFKEGANWTIYGGDSAIANGTEIMMASDSAGSPISSTNAFYVTYLGSGGSWAGGITALDIVGNDLVGTYGYVAFEKALGLEPGMEGYDAAAALTEFTDIANTDDEYAPLLNLSLDEAERTITEITRGPEMANALMHLQGVFSDQIRDRTRSYLRQKDWGGAASHAPQGAMGPDLWESTMDGLNENLPSWDISQTARNIDDSLPRLDRQGAHEAPAKQPYAHTPQSERNKIEIPSAWQAWGRGYGSYFDQGETDGFGGYEATIGGGAFGVDKRFDHMLLGLGGGYAKTDLTGEWGSNGEADTVYGTVYTIMAAERAFLEFNANYAFNDVETKDSNVTQYEGEYDAYSVGMYVGGGVGIPVFGSVLLTPEASMLASYYDRESYTETSPVPAPGAYPDLLWDDYDQWSYLGSLGATLSMIGQIDSFNLEMGFQPEIRAHWLHEFNAEMDDDALVMDPGGIATPLGVALQAREEDLVKLGAGVRFSKWGSDTLELGLDFDVVLGEDYEAYVGSAKLLHRF